MPLPLAPDGQAGPASQRAIGGKHLANGRANKPTTGPASARFIASERSACLCNCGCVCLLLMTCFIAGVLLAHQVLPSFAAYPANYDSDGVVDLWLGF